MKKAVKVKTFHSQITGEIARGYLKANGIESWLELSKLNDGVKNVYYRDDKLINLYVYREDVVKAKKLLDQAEQDNLQSIS